MNIYFTKCLVLPAVSASARCEMWRDARITWRLTGRRRPSYVWSTPRPSTAGSWPGSGGSSGADTWWSLWRGTLSSTRRKSRLIMTCILFPKNGEKQGWFTDTSWHKYFVFILSFYQFFRFWLDTVWLYYYYVWNKFTLFQCPQLLYISNVVFLNEICSKYLVNWGTQSKICSIHLFIHEQMLLRQKYVQISTKYAMLGLKRMNRSS